MTRRRLLARLAGAILALVVARGPRPRERRVILSNRPVRLSKVQLSTLDGSLVPGWAKEQQDQWQPPSSPASPS